MPEESSSRLVRRGGALVVVLGLLVFVLLAPLRLWLLISLTHVGGEAQKVWAIERLGDCGPAALPTLTQAISGESMTVRSEALRVLPKVGPEACRAIPLVLKVLATAEVLSLNDGEAVTELIELYPEDTLSELIWVLNNANSDRDRRMQCRYYLAQLGSRARPALPAILVRGQPHDTNETIQIIGTIVSIGCKTKEVEDWLRSLEGHANKDLEARARRALRDLERAR